MSIKQSLTDPKYDKINNKAKGNNKFYLKHKLLMLRDYRRIYTYIYVCKTQY